jgi:hypothetical protein
MGARCGLCLVVASLVFSSSAFACDPCALYNASRLQGHSEETLTLAISEQFTEFDLANGVKENSVSDAEYVKDFSTTQLTLAYDLTERFGIQANLPVIARRYTDVENFRTSEDYDAGIGDASLAATYSVVDYRDTDWSAIVGVTGGVKFPTGETGLLNQVVNDEERGANEGIVQLLAHHQIGSASGGRALVFGTGSFDYILGLNFLARYQRYFTISTAQYTIRTEGDYGYKFANDLIGSIGGGYYFLLEHDYTAGALMVLYGEFKSKDDLNGELVSGSQYSNLYLGPEFISTWGENFGFQAGVSFRVTGEDVNATVVPDVRLLASISYRFL